VQHILSVIPRSPYPDNCQPPLRFGLADDGIVTSITGGRCAPSSAWSHTRAGSAYGKARCARFARPTASASSTFRGGSSTVGALRTLTSACSSSIRRSVPTRAAPASLPSTCTGSVIRPHSRVCVYMIPSKTTGGRVNISSTESSPGPSNGSSFMRNGSPPACGRAAAVTRSCAPHA
jgi:hypothetical protein